jgi:DNA-binding transcriptional ArsR family regulator
MVKTLSPLGVELFIQMGEQCAMDLDEILIALADPTRRAILQRLSGGAARVTEIAAPFDISLNSISKHIRILERADLVRRRIIGREHFLSFNPQPLREASTWIQQHQMLWTERLDARAEKTTPKR